MKCSVRSIACALAATGVIMLATIACLFFWTSDDEQGEPAAPVPRDAIITVYGWPGSGAGIAIFRGNDIFIWTMASVLEYREELRPGASAMVVADCTLVQREGTLMHVVDVIAHGGHDGPALLRVRPGKLHHFRCSSAAFAVGYAPPWSAPALAVSSSGELCKVVYLEKSYHIGGYFYDVIRVENPENLPTGSGVFRADGQCIGLLVERSSPGGCLVLPVRELERWARENGVGWAIDLSLPFPSEEEWRKFLIKP